MESSLGSRVCNALIILHTFTGCDSTSAFYGKGKRTAFSLLLGNESFIDAFGELGCSFLLSDNITKALERFVFCLYGQSNAQTVNDAHYKLFCVASSSLPEKTIPPTTDALSQHCQRANYQAAIFKSSLTPKMNAPPPTEHGWHIDNGDLSVTWMTQKPAPDSILHTVYCSCKQGRCEPTTRCSCVNAGLPCTDVCKCTGCVNVKNLADELLNEGTNVENCDDSDAD